MSTTTTRSAFWPPVLRRNIERLVLTAERGASRAPPWTDHRFDAPASKFSPRLMAGEWFLGGTDRHCPLLVEQDLVEAHVTGVKGQYDRFKIRKEDGSGEPYLVPTGGRLVSVPVEFFLRGWHLVLTPNEIATYLVILNHKTRVGPRTDGVAVPELVRDTVYGLSAEAYLSAHELAEFGLIDIREPDTEDTTGTKDTEGGSPAGDAGDHKRLPHRFIFPPKGGHDFSRPAADVVLERLTSNSLPPRI